ncbi:MAG: tripartite tricarboxylate transporter TctB family protein, partial [Comamonas sp.]
IPGFGLIVAIIGLVFIASAAGHNVKWKEVLVLSIVLAIGSYTVFVWALNLQFPVWPTFIVG